VSYSNLFKGNECGAVNSIGPFNENIYGYFLSKLCSKSDIFLVLIKFKFLFGVNDLKLFRFSEIFGVNFLFCLCLIKLSSTDFLISLFLLFII